VFKARSKEAALLLISAVLVMWGRAPISAVISEGFAAIADWMMAVPNTAGMRGIVIGIGIGVISIGIRTLLGIERGHLGGKAE
jgi:ABC-type enterobactin transport system permease subunit